MKDGFLIAATATPEIKIADPAYNADKIIEYMTQAKEMGVSLLVFPELSVTGYTCGDLFAARMLADAAMEALARIRAASKDFGALVFVGAPLRHHGKLYNCAVAVCGGEILGVVPKKHLPNYGEFYEKRNFTAAPDGVDRISLFGEDVPFGTNLIFRASNMPEFSVAAEICEDLWVVTPPSLSHAAAGAKIIVNLSASNEIIGQGGLQTRACHRTVRANRRRICIRRRGQFGIDDGHGFFRSQHDCGERQASHGARAVRRGNADLRARCIPPCGREAQNGNLFFRIRICGGSPDHSF